MEPQELNLNLPPGETLKLKCESALDSSIQIGQIINENLMIVGIKGNEVEVGPLRFGELKFEIKCSDSKVLNGVIKVEKSPEPITPMGPLLPEALSYSWLLWFLLALFLILLGLLISYLLRRNREAKLTKKLKESYVAKVLSPQEQFDEIDRQIKVSKILESEDPVTLIDFYKRAYQALRLLLEDTLGLKTSSESTREFLGSLRAAGLSRGLSSQVIGRCESFFTNADLVRFSGQVPNIGERRNFGVLFCGFADIRAMSPLKTIQATEVKRKQ